MRLLAEPPLDHTALVDAATGQAVSYGEMMERALAIAERFGARKSLVFVLARNDLFTAHVYAATLLRDHTIAFLDGGRPVADHAQLIAAYAPDWLAGPKGTAAALEPLGASCVSVDDVLGGELIRLSQAEPKPIHPELAVLLSTSGTTGSCRYVRLSRRNIDANASSIAECLSLDDDERPITSLPLHYSFGLSVLNSHWMVGATIVLSSASVVEGRFWDAVRRHECTSLAGVPYTYQMLERVGYRRLQLPTVRNMQQAGGALDRRLTRLYADHMSAKDGRFFVMYGQTEATARMACVPFDKLAEKLGSAGVAIPGGRFSIEPARSGEGGTDNTGEIVYSGPNVMMGYSTCAADLKVGDELHGVLHTGDLGYLDQDGYLFVVGRSKRIAKIHGVRISLDEMERSLQEHGPAAVVGRDDRIVGFCAFGDSVSLERLGRQLAKGARVNRTSIRLQRVDEIPMSGSGKVDYRQLESWAAG